MYFINSDLHYMSHKICNDDNFGLVGLDLAALIIC